MDLTAYYGARLDESWATTVSGPECSLAVLTPGVHELEGRPWDVRGVIQVASRNHGADGSFPVFPEKVTGIPLPARARRLHFLTAVVWGRGRWREKPEIGRLVFHFADGRQAVRPLVLGVDVLDWFGNTPALEKIGFPGHVAWQGFNLASLRSGAGLLLFRVTWENPWPDSPLLSLDFEAVQGCPFLTAITAEP